ncbi:uncharacterized protein N7500_000214 [Penicillium coprophilum]|uniref:uncharacterized protein n=1 Tax=Penicillium coprophilum TaxID=36646 RepID=UPI00238B6046|nr:uncharacterized protein N7500_000214 [Penicillium coprophilum]KAJ5177515.1 hypothetical protein N7500_000214 [Penicillium coprophilum]
MSTRRVREPDNLRIKIIRIHDNGGFIIGHYCASEPVQQEGSLKGKTWALGKMKNIDDGEAQLREWD